MTLHILIQQCLYFCLFVFALRDLIHIFLVWALEKKIREINQLNETHTLKILLLQNKVRKQSCFPTGGGKIITKTYLF